MFNKKDNDIVVEFSSEQEMQEYIKGHKLARRPYSKKLDDREYMMTGDSEGRRQTRAYKMKKLLSRFTFTGLNGDNDLVAN